MLPTFQPCRPFHRRVRIAAPPTPPGPPVAHVVDVERMSATVLRFTFDTVILDLGGCGDLRVNDLGPSAATQTSDYTLEAAYPDMANGDPWTAHSSDGEPIFANGAVLADDGGIVPVWA